MEKTSKKETRKEHVLIRPGSSKSLYCKDIVEPCHIKGVQKQPFADVLQNRCPCKFCKIHRKTPVLESRFSKVVGLKRLHHKCFSMIFAKLLRTTYNKTPCTIKYSLGRI